MPQPTHKITVFVHASPDGATWRCNPHLSYLESMAKDGYTPNTDRFLIKCDDSCITDVEPLPKPIEAGDWVTITGWKDHPPGTAYEVLHVANGRAWIRGRDCFDSLIKLEDIERTAF